VGGEHGTQLDRRVVERATCGAVEVEGPHPVAFVPVEEQLMRDGRAHPQLGGAGSERGEALVGGEIIGHHDRFRIGR